MLQGNLCMKSCTGLTDLNSSLLFFLMWLSPGLPHDCCKILDLRSNVDKQNGWPFCFYVSCYICSKTVQSRWPQQSDADISIESHFIVTSFAVSKVRNVIFLESHDLIMTGFFFSLSCFSEWCLFWSDLCSGLQKLQLVSHQSCKSYRGWKHVLIMTE